MNSTLTLFILTCCAYGAVGQAFITTWKTDNPGKSASNQITIPTKGIGYSYSIYWEQLDNATINGTIPGPITGDYTITFPSAGTYRVSINGAFPRIYFFGDPLITSSPSSDSNKILTIEQWGDIVWTSMANAFQGCLDLTIPAEDAPNLTQVTDMRYMFASAQSFNQPIDHWDVSHVTDMSLMFAYAKNFNQPLGTWQVNNVTNMESMFNEAANFNQPIGTWNVSSVTNMGFMFWVAESFNQPIDNWDVSQVTSMSGMFAHSSFNQPIATWNVTSVTSMAQMFNHASSFNQPIGTWNVGNVTSMIAMFAGATSFNQSLESWNVGNVTTMHGMFAEASSFDQPLLTWNVSNVRDMDWMFYKASSFNQPLGSWNVSSVLIMNRMLNLSGLDIDNYDQTLIGWSAQNVKENLILGAEGLKYCAGEADRAHLITNKGWSITGDSKGCQSGDITLMPNVITPNGDSKNDSFVIPKFHLYPINTLMVYDRWGQLVYSVGNYDNNWAAEGLSGGIYFYTLIIDGGRKRIKGWLQVIR
jgi:gliding motility-associated-like protein